MPKTLFKTEIPYGLIWDEGTVDVLLNDDSYHVSFKRLSRQVGDPRKSPVIDQSQGLEVLHDRSGGVTYTTIDVLFSICIQDNQRVFRQALTVINRLIEVYRFTTGEFHLEAISETDLQRYVVLYMLEDGSSMVPFEETVGFGSGLTIMRTAPIPEEAKKILLSGNNLPIARILLMNAKREKLGGNHRLAVVEAETAFEVLVDEIVARHYRSQSIPDQAIRMKLECGLENLLRDHLPKSCGESFVGTAEWSAWKNDLYELRNAVVHDGVSVNGDKVNKALAAAEKALDWLEKRMPN